MSPEQMEARRRSSQRLNLAALLFSAFSLAFAIATKSGVLG